MSMIIISAMARKNRVIGNENGVPWDKPGEYQHFKECVEGKPVIMGRKTYDIVKTGTGQSYEGKPNSPMFVVSKSLKESGGRLDDADVCGSLEEAIEKARALNKDFYIAGGESIYRMAIPIADKMYLSYMDGDYQGTAHFPQFNEDEWNITKREPHKDEEWEFVVYERKV